MNAINVTAASGSRAFASTARSEDTRLLKASQDFEAVFLSMIWREMQKSTGTDLGGWDIVAEQAIGKQWAATGGIGLAKVIYRTLSKHIAS